MKTLRTYRKEPAGKVRTRPGLCHALSIWTALCIITGTALQAQYREWPEPEDPEIQQLYNIGDDEFPLGMFKYIYPDARSVTDLWSLLEELGLSIVLTGSSDKTRFDQFVNATNRLSDGRVIALWNSKAEEAASGREIIFYPFDSTQTEWWGGYHPCVFTQYDDAVTLFNSVESVPHPGTPNTMVARRESYYDQADAGNTIASGIAFDWNSAQTSRFPEEFVNGQWEEREEINSWEMCTQRKSKADREPYYYIVTTAHLFENPPSPVQNNVPLLRIKVYYEIARGDKYVDANGNVQTSTTNQRVLYQTLDFTKGELAPAGSNPQGNDWYEYSTVSKQINLRNLPGGMGGPVHPDATGQRMDLEVIYLGGEPMALHSVAIRDSIGEMLLGTTQNAIDYRNQLRLDMDDLLNDPQSSQLREQIIGVQGLDEPDYSYFLGYKTLNQILRERYQSQGGDSLSVYSALGQPHVQDLGRAPIVAPEVYSNDRLKDISAGHLHIPYTSFPSIKQHNGGRFGIPELFDIHQLGTPTYDATLPGRIRAFTESYQEGFWGRYAPYEQPWPYNTRHLSNKPGGLGPAAEVSRRTGARVIPILGSTTWVTTAEDANGDTVTTATHIQERSEVRLMANMALCYGATGIFYYDPAWERFLFEPHTLLGERCCLGNMGYPDATGLEDTVHNWIDWTRYDSPQWPYAGGTLSDVIPNMYTGWRSRTAEIRWLNKTWLPDAGQKMTGLRWRDAYSVHFQDVRPHEATGITPRPLPSNEIVTEVTARSPWSDEPDSAHTTYVELGLFYTKTGEVNGQRDRLKDTNHIFVVNRRTLETPQDLTDSLTTQARETFDEISETRVVSLKFNLTHPFEGSPIHQQYTFIRVREIVKDPIAPPGYASTPAPLDTVIYGDSSVAIVLRPGSASLLQITYVQPDSSLLNAELRFNSQRKIVFDGRRYHSTYMRWNPGPGGSFVDTIFYRRSLPVNEKIQTILWEPTEFPVSIDGGPQRFENRFPSLTLRFVPGPGGTTDTLVTIVWTCHQTQTCTGWRSDCREVVARDLNVTNGMHSSIWKISNYDGPDHAEWGTPVVSSLDGSDLIAWSDMNRGIQAKARITGPGMGWWLNPPGMTATLNVSSAMHCGTAVGRYPSMPPFAHRASNDSNVGLVWNQPHCNGSKDIGYVRVEHYNQFVVNPPPLPPSLIPSLRLHNLGNVSPAPGQYYRPSIDQTQDVWNRVQEGVTWEEDLGVNTRIWFRSVFTETRSNPSQDIIEPTQFWSWAQVYGPKAVGYNAWAHPTTASLNEVYDLAHAYDSAFFSVQYMNYPNLSGFRDMSQAKIRYAYPNFKQGWPKSYAFEGHYPHGSASPVRQPDHHAILYGAFTPYGDSVLRTSRQFFGFKTVQRPGNYIAEGREAVLTASREKNHRTGFVVELDDIWIADAKRSEPIELVRHSDAAEHIDDLSRVQDLMRSQTFTAADLTTVGITVRARWFEDAPGSPATAALTVTGELVNAKTGSVMHQFNEVTMEPGTVDYEMTLSPELDLSSGEYFVRLRLDTAGFTVKPDGKVSLYPVGEIARMVQREETKERESWPVPGAPSIRLTVLPNPFDTRTDISYSIPEEGEVTVTVYDELGKEIARPVDGEAMPAGRYSTALSAGNLATGSYLIEVRLERAGELRARSVEQVVLHR